ncbi:DUF6318 family protein [uncultured Serinicoccus sp.]|uniref:DUF6318 family protein n=1 Tax=uncultured Serinicoccus sp. TaxID=735514 RepID=UPI002634AD91|nr:DUF6318 family protein [uncultured Serinicoccus sp.]
MRRTTIIAAAASLVLLPACTEQSEPSPMPTSEDALTTATEEPEDVAVTSEPVETEEETSEPAAEGPPEMPAEAEEQTEAGAEAFVLHYIDLINFTGRFPQVGLLEDLSGDDCASCLNHEESVVYAVENGDYLAGDTFIPGEVQSLFMDDSSRISVAVEQPGQHYLREGEPIGRELESEQATLVFRTTWAEGWQIEEITIEQ